MIDWCWYWFGYLIIICPCMCRTLCQRCDISLIVRSVLLSFRFLVSRYFVLSILNCVYGLLIPALSSFSFCWYIRFHYRFISFSFRYIMALSSPLCVTFFMKALWRFSASFKRYEIGYGYWIFLQCHGTFNC